MVTWTISMGEQSNVGQKLGQFSSLAVVLSMFACYGTLAVVGALALLGITVDIHEGAWAAAIAAFAWLAFFGIAANYRKVRTGGPVILAGVGVLLITWVMFVSFSRPLEILGFAALAAAAVWERRVKACHPAQDPSTN